MKVAILLASYNGEKFIKEQLDSLLMQTEGDFSLIIRDDGSTDKTFEIEQDYARRYPDKIRAIQNTGTKHGAKYNFWELCKIGIRTDADYFLFCDQDDVWKPDKIRQTLAAMEAAEGQSRGQPVLVHTDLTVVDENLAVLGGSFIRYRNLNPACRSINRLLVQNNVTGCTVMVNRPLLEKAMELTDADGMVMHDWWLSLTASLFGQIVFLNTPTVFYRQHGGNVVGATKVNSLKFILRRLREVPSVRKKLYQAARQAASLLETYDESLSEADKALIGTLADIRQRKKAERVYLLIKHRLLKQGWIQIIGQLVLM